MVYCSKYDSNIEFIWKRITLLYTMLQSATDSRTPVSEKLREEVLKFE
jgi:hypothetical protein